MGICASKPYDEPPPPELNAGQRRASYIAKETSSKDAAPPFPRDLIGFHSNHGIKPAGFGSAAKINQDRGVIQYPLAEDNQQMLMAVYDGHGQHGEYCSEFVAFECIELLESDKDALQADPRAVLFKQIVETDNRLRKKRDVPSYESGTTAIVCIMRPDRIWAACVGDSRAVMARETSSGAWSALDLSVDQKPDDPGERQRIESKGGFVSEASDMYGPARVWRGAYGLGPGLAMARSMGDHAVAELGVHSEPEITETAVTDADRCVILASDGVWEFITSQEAVDLVFKNKHNAAMASKALIAMAADRWKKEEGNYRDDITAIVCFLPALKTLARASASEAGGQSQKSKAEFDGDLQAKEDPQAVAMQEAVAAVEGGGGEAAAAVPAESGDSPSFARRRLSVASLGSSGDVTKGAQ